MSEDGEEHDEDKEDNMDNDVAEDYRVEDVTDDESTEDDSENKITQATSGTCNQITCLHLAFIHNALFIHSMQDLDSVKGVCDL